MDENQEKLNFDSDASRAAKDYGMEIAAAHSAILLTIGRIIAIEIAQARGEVTADDVQRELLRRGYALLGPAAGKLFSEKHWHFTGRRVLSQRESNHARELKVWRLKGTTTTETKTQ